MINLPSDQVKKFCYHVLKHDNKKFFCQRGILLFLVFFLLLILFVLRPKTAEKQQTVGQAENLSYACPLNISDITGVMQWNDGWPLSVYGRASHGGNGNFNSWQVVDVNGYYNSSVYAPVNGLVAAVIDNGSAYIPRDQTLGISGDDGRYYELTHNQEVFAGVNQRVSVGEKIGRLVSKQEAETYNKQCDLSKEFTAPFAECIKVHLHFAVYRGSAYDQPFSGGGETLQFLQNYCHLIRPPGSNPEFPDLPTLNCAKIAGNLNINLCFMEKSSPPPPTATSRPTATPTLLPTPFLAPTSTPTSSLMPTLTPVFTPTLVPMIQPSRSVESTPTLVKKNPRIKVPPALPFDQVCSPGAFIQKDQAESVFCTRCNSSGTGWQRNCSDFGDGSNRLEWCECCLNCFSDANQCGDCFNKETSRLLTEEFLSPKESFFLKIILFVKKIFRL
jgi:hypothetical protein